jgi:hypothetical protein
MNRIVFKLSSCVLITLILMGCSSGGTNPPPSPSPNKADFNAYSATLPSWQQFSPALADSEAKSGETSTFNETVDDAEYVCMETPYTLTQTPDKIITLNPDVSSLWVGSLLQGKYYKGGIGSLSELPIRERAPLAIYLDILGPSVTRTVENPDGAKVQQAISELIIQAQNQNILISSSITYSSAITQSVEQAALKAGVSAKFLSGNVKGTLDASFSRKANETTVTAHFYQKLFTVTMVSPQTPADFFADSFTQADLEQQVRLGTIGTDNLPVYVSTITYGRILHYSLTSKASDETITGALNASFEGLKNNVGATLTGEQIQMLQESKVNFVAVGGEQQSALSIIRTGDLQEYFKKDAVLTSATPISYSVKNVGDGSNALISETINYTLTECQAVTP